MFWTESGYRRFEYSGSILHAYIQTSSANSPVYAGRSKNLLKPHGSSKGNYIQ